MNTFSVHIATPTRELRFGNVDYLSTDGTDGRFGIMRGALGRIEMLCAGHIDISSGDEKTVIACGEGVMRVEGDTVTILCEYVRLPDEIEDGADKSSGEREYKYAKARLQSSIASGNDKKSDG